MEIEIALGWLGMMIGLVGFVGVWGWLLNAVQEDAYERNKEAEKEALENALAEGEKALGPNHPSVVTALNNLGKFYKTQRQYAQAEPLYKRALAIGEKSLGPYHLSVATTLNNLAALYDTQGQYVQAEPLYNRARAIKDKAKS